MKVNFRFITAAIACLLFPLDMQAAGSEVILPAGEETVAFTLSPGWKLATKDVSTAAAVVEFLPEGQIAETWRDSITFQTIMVKPEITAEGFAADIGKHWAANCRSAESSILQKKMIGSYRVILGLTDCPRAEYSNAPEYMMYTIIRGKSRIHLLQRSARKEQAKKVAEDEWIRLMDSINACPASSISVEDCLPGK